MIEHEITVAQLRELLLQLKDDDILIPNTVANLAVVRNDKYIGFVDLLKDNCGINIGEDE